MSRRVRGSLFVDYVRMLRAQKGADWSHCLEREDLDYLHETIEPTAWYPVESFERMGLAILGEIARSDLGLVREWGKVTVDELRASMPDLFVAADPRESIMRFEALRRALFDYPVAEVVAIRDGSARISISYGMTARAEEAAIQQSLGFFERLLEVTGATSSEVTLEREGWTDAGPPSIISLRWEL